MVHGLSRGGGNNRALCNRTLIAARHARPVKSSAFPVGLGLVLAAALGMAEEKNSAQRLERAQQGMVEASWPRKPDDRLSPLSGKMKEIATISPRFYGGSQEISVKTTRDWQKEASLGAKGPWVRGGERGWEEARWNRTKDWAGGTGRHEKFQPAEDPANRPSLVFPELGRKPAPDWSSRGSALAGQTDGSLRRYEGRLTRVRRQVALEEPPENTEKFRDLGSQRQERFRPDEVEKMLSQPFGEFRGGAKERSPAASPPATADN